MNNIGKAFDKAALGRKLKAARLQARIKQKEIAIRLGVTVSTISDYENGRIRVPGDCLDVYTELCGMTADELLGTGKPTPTGDEEATKVLAVEKRELIDAVNQLTPEDRKTALALLKSLARHG
jgi:transcriptional regulator with XRE-family HTH domain